MDGNLTHLILCLARTLLMYLMTVSVHGREATNFDYCMLRQCGWETLQIEYVVQPFCLYFSVSSSVLVCSLSDHN
jgi:hypothetical protein